MIGQGAAFFSGHTGMEMTKKDLVKRLTNLVKLSLNQPRIYNQGASQSESMEYSKADYFDRFAAIMGEFHEARKTKKPKEKAKKGAA